MSAAARFASSCEASKVLQLRYWYSYPDSSLFESALSMAKTIAAEVGIAPPIAVSQRDVPGWTRVS